MTRPSIIRYFVFSYCWLGLAYYLSEIVKEGELWVVVIGIVILGAPILAMGLYSATVRKIYGSHAYLAGSWMRDFFGRRFLSTLFWIIFSLLAGFSALFWFGTFKNQEWILVIASVPLFVLIFDYVYKGVGAQRKRYVITVESLRYAQWFYALLASLLLVCLSSFLGADESPQRLSEIMKEEQTTPLSDSKSILVQYTVRYAGYYDQARAVAFASVSQQGSAWPLVITFFCGALLFFNLGISFSAFLIPRAEFRRIALPLDDSDEPGHPNFQQVFSISFVTTFLVLFIYIHGMLGLESWLSDHPEVREEIAKAEKAAIPHVERIEGRIYKLGTIENLEQLKVELLKKYSDNIERVAKLSDIGFDNMEANVDPYLDWYYSLPAEYLRLGALLTISLEEEIQTDLHIYLKKNDPFRALDQSLQILLTKNESLKKEYENAVAALLAANEVTQPFPDIKIERDHSMVDVMSPVRDIEVIDLNLRMTSAGLSGISVVVAAKVVTKAVSKGTVKLAGQAMVKAAATKIAGGAIGGVIGGLLGSVIPVAGTLIGTGVGTFVGIVLGVSVDALLLTVEENLTRDAFRQQIVDSITEARDDFRKSLAPTS
jgi:hypothetical protein